MRLVISESVCKGEAPQGKYHSIIFLFFSPYVLLWVLGSLPPHSQFCVCLERTKVLSITGSFVFPVVWTLKDLPTFPMYMWTLLEPLVTTSPSRWPRHAVYRHTPFPLTSRTAASPSTAFCTQVNEPQETQSVGNTYAVWAYMGEMISTSDLFYSYTWLIV